MTTLALLGGAPMRDAKTNPWPQWPVWDKKEEKALIEVLNSGVWSYNGPKEIEFDKDFEMTHTWADGWKLQKNSLFSEGQHVGAIVGFKTKKGEVVHAKVASSFISPKQALLNLTREIGQDSFEDTKQKAKNNWEKGVKAEY